MFSILFAGKIVVLLYKKIPPWVIHFYIKNFITHKEDQDNQCNRGNQGKCPCNYQLVYDQYWTVESQFREVWRMKLQKRCCRDFSSNFHFPHPRKWHQIHNLTSYLHVKLSIDQPFTHQLIRSIKENPTSNQPCFFSLYFQSSNMFSWLVDIPCSLILSSPKQTI